MLRRICKRIPSRYCPRRWRLRRMARLRHMLTSIEQNETFSQSAGPPHSNIRPYLRSGTVLRLPLFVHCCVRDGRAPSAVPTCLAPPFRNQDLVAKKPSLAYLRSNFKSNEEVTAFAVAVDCIRTCSSTSTDARRRTAAYGD